MNKLQNAFNLFVWNVLAQCGCCLPWSASQIWVAKAVRDFSRDTTGIAANGSKPIQAVLRLFDPDVAVRLEEVKSKEFQRVKMCCFGRRSPIVVLPKTRRLRIEVCWSRKELIKHAGLLRRVLSIVIDWWRDIGVDEISCCMHFGNQPGLILGAFTVKEHHPNQLAILRNRRQGFKQLLLASVCVDADAPFSVDSYGIHLLGPGFKTLLSHPSPIDVIWATRKSILQNKLQLEAMCATNQLSLAVTDVRGRACNQLPRELKSKCDYAVQNPTWPIVWTLYRNQGWTTGDRIEFFVSSRFQIRPSPSVFEISESNVSLENLQSDISGSLNIVSGHIPNFVRSIDISAISLASFPPLGERLNGSTGISTFLRRRFIHLNHLLCRPQRVAIAEKRHEVRKLLKVNAKWNGQRSQARARKAIEYTLNQLDFVKRENWEIENVQLT